MIPGKVAKHAIIITDQGIKCSTKATANRTIVPTRVSLGLILENKDATSKLIYSITSILQAL